MPPHYSSAYPQATPRSRGIFTVLLRPKFLFVSLLTFGILAFHLSRSETPKSVNLEDPLSDQASRPVSAHDTLPRTDTDTDKPLAQVDVSHEQSTIDTDVEKALKEGDSQRQPSSQSHLENPNPIKLPSDLSLEKTTDSTDVDAPIINKETEQGTAEIKTVISDPTEDHKLTTETDNNDEGSIVNRETTTEDKPSDGAMNDTKDVIDGVLTGSEKEQYEEGDAQETVEPTETPESTSIPTITPEAMMMTNTSETVSQSEEPESESVEPKPSSMNIVPAVAVSEYDLATITEQNEKSVLENVPMSGAVEHDNLLDSKEKVEDNDQELKNEITSEVGQATS